MEGIIGHTHVVSLFDRLLQNGQLSHAYCLVGPVHIGKGTIARQVAAAYLHTSAAQLVHHPDMHMLAPEEKENGKIKIEAVRTCKEFLSHTSVHGYGLVVLITDAHTLTDEAANALLKSLEEPPENTLFLLTTPFPSSLPQTILSRCQTLQCVPVSTQCMVETLTSRGVSAQDAAIMASHADGRIGLAVSWAASTELWHQYLGFVDTFTRLQEAPLYEKIQEVHVLVSDETVSLREYVDRWCSIDIQSLRRAVQQGETIAESDVNRVVQAYTDVLHNLSTNTNKQLTLEQFLFHLS
jgi:hypothetical protein